MQALYDFVAGMLPRHDPEMEEDLSRAEAVKTLQRLRGIQRRAAGPASGTGTDDGGDLPWNPMEMSFLRAVQSAKQAFRPLLVVLDSPLHPDSDDWLRDSLLSEQVSTELRRSGVMVWTGNAMGEDGHQAAKQLRAQCFPFCCLLSCPSESSQARTKLIGSQQGAGVSADELSAFLGAALAAASPDLDRIRAQRATREQDRLIREEQQERFAAALEADRERERAKEEAEEAEELQEAVRQSEEATDEQAVEEARTRLDGHPEPPPVGESWGTWAENVRREHEEAAAADADESGARPRLPAALLDRLQAWSQRQGQVARQDVSQLRVTLPSGDAMVRRFLPDERCRVLRDVLVVVLDEVEMLPGLRKMGFRIKSRSSRKAVRVGNTTTESLVACRGDAGTAPEGGRAGDWDAGEDLERSLKEVGLFPNDSLQVSFPNPPAGDSERA